MAIPRYYCADPIRRSHWPRWEILAVDDKGNGPALKQNQRGNHGLNVEERYQGAVEGADHYPSEAADDKAHQYGPQGDIAGTQDVLNEDGRADRAALADADVLPPGSSSYKGHPDGQNYELRSAKEDVRDVPVKRPVDHGNLEVISTLDQINYDEYHQNREGKERFDTLLTRVFSLGISMTSLCDHVHHILFRQMHAAEFAYDLPVFHHDHPRTDPQHLVNF